MRRFFATKAAETNGRRWGRGRECGGRWGRGQHAVWAILPDNHLTVHFLFVCTRFFPDVTLRMRIHSLTRVPSKVLASSIHSLAHKSKAWLFIDSVFPVRLAAWELAILSIPCPLHKHSSINPVFDISSAIFAKNVSLPHSQSLYHKCTHMNLNPSLSNV